MTNESNAHAVTGRARRRAQELGELLARLRMGSLLSSQDVELGRARAVESAERAQLARTRLLYKSSTDRVRSDIPDASSWSTARHPDPADGHYIGMYHQAKQEVRWLEAVADLHADLLQGVEEEPLLTIARHAIRAGGAGACLIMVAAPDCAGQPTVHRHLGAYADEVLQRYQASLALIASRTLTSGQPIIGAARDALLEQPQTTTQDIAETVPSSREAGLPSLLAAPLRSPQGWPGALILVRSSGQYPFGTADATAVKAYARRASTALQLTDPLNPRQMSAIWDDRERIARDLHDHVIQQLFATELNLSGTSDLLDDHPDASDRILRSISTIDQAIQQLRDTIFSLTARRGLGHDDAR